MKTFVIGHSEAVLGFALIGISGQATQTAAEAREAIQQALRIEDLGILMITEDVAQQIGSEVDDLKIHRNVPLVIEIPAPGRELEPRQSLGEVIQKTVGLKI